MSEGPQALIIDDDPAIGKLLQRNLKKLGFDSIHRVNGESGLQFLEANHVDLVCLDLMLPNLSGFQICEAIRKLPRNANVPVLVISARSSPDARAFAEQAGCNGYLVKPLRRGELEREVRRLLEKAASQSGEWNTLSSTRIKRGG